MVKVLRNEKGQFVKGHTSSMNGYKHSDTIKKIISDAHKGRHLSLNTEFKKGHVFSKETKKKISKTLKGKYIKEKSWSWKGGKIKNYSGYILILNPKHPYSTKDGYIREHRLVMEKHIDRYLKPSEQVHHKGIKYPIGSIENKQDNRIENLQLFSSNSAHISFHQSLKKH